MKICQLCNLDFTLYHFMLPLMRGMNKAGHEVVGVCSQGPYAELVALFARENFDIVHVHNPVAALVGRIAAWRAGVPCIVYTAHGFYFHERMPLLKRGVFIALEWLAGRVTDVLFTQSREDAQTARALKLIAGKHIEAIGNGVDGRRFHAAGSNFDRARIRKKIGTADERTVIMSIARLVAEKGVPELIEAMAHVDADLWVIGERLESDHADGIEDALSLARTDTRIRERVHFLGYRKDIPDLLRAADIFVSASHREGMPRSIIEAMMCALPVVATNIRGSREEVVHGKTGFLVEVKQPAELARALNGLAGDPVMRKKLGSAGRVRALDLYAEAKVIARQIETLGL